MVLITRTDEWTYEGHDIAYNPDGDYKLYIDNERITTDELGSQIYRKYIVRDYIDEKYETGVGNGTIDDYMEDDQ